MNGYTKKMLSVIAASVCGLACVNAHAVVTAEGCPSYQPATDANVFNWRFYLNAHADLPLHGITTAIGACAHWLNNGINEGRQGHAGFQSAQYLQRYPDLRNAFGATGY